MNVVKLYHISGRCQAPLFPTAAGSAFDRGGKYKNRVSRGERKTNIARHLGLDVQLLKPEERAIL